MNGRVEIRGVKYTLTRQPHTTQTAHPCAGCVARNDKHLCEALPSSCLGHRLIWIKEK